MALAATEFHSLSLSPSYDSFPRAYPLGDVDGKNSPTESFLFPEHLKSFFVSYPFPILLYFLPELTNNAKVDVISENQLLVGRPLLAWLLHSKPIYYLESDGVHYSNWTLKKRIYFRSSAASCLRCLLLHPVHAIVIENIRYTCFSIHAR